MKRVFDVTCAMLVLGASFPLLLVAAVGVRMSSPGPVLYHATRVGRGNRRFSMFKFRTMHTGSDGPVITAKHDSRVFWFGRLLRVTKVDELPQFLNVLRGEMSIVGPRPEDPKIVDSSYSPWMLETLSVRPGITSPGAVYYYSHGEDLIDPDNPEQSYVETLLPLKLAIDRAYMERANALSDAGCVIRTAGSIFGRLVGLQLAPARRDLQGARRWLEDSRFASDL